jgi:hypothetical protein
MKIYEGSQIGATETERIQLLESETHLSGQHILELFKDKLAEDEKKKTSRRRSLAAVMAAGIILLISVNWNSIYTFASEFMTKIIIKSQDIELPEVHMNKISVNKPDNLKRFSPYAIYTAGKSYSSLNDCTDELGIEILTSDLAYDASYEDKVTLYYPVGDEKFEPNNVQINDYMYIIGDLKEFERQGNAATYKAPGTNEKYASPVSLGIEFYITGTKDSMQSSTVDYSGLSYAYYEVYEGSNGLTAQILGNSNEGKSNYTAVFYNKDLKYTLEGRVELVELKRIIDSFK